MATTTFLKDFDTLLESILTDYVNLDPQPDTSKGSMVFIKAACLASMLYGLYKYQDYLANQMFPDSADSENLDHWGSVYGLVRQSIVNDDGSSGKESDTDFLARLLQTLRKPSAGGNHYDWANWCMFYESGNRIVTTTNLDTYGNGYYFTKVNVYTPSVGKVDLIVSPNDPTLAAAALTELRTLVTANLELLRPVTANSYTIYDPVDLLTDVIIKIDAASYTAALAATIQADLEQYIDSMDAGQSLYQSKISAIAVNDGANGVTVLSPSADVIVSNYQKIARGYVIVQSM